MLSPGTEIRPAAIAARPPKATAGAAAELQDDTATLTPRSTRKARRNDGIDTIGVVND